MAVKDLTDEQLREFVKNPKDFLSTLENYEKIFDLTDPSVRARVEKYEREMNLPAHSLRVDRPEAAK